MAFVVADRVRETTTSTGTGTITLAGPYAGFQAFSTIGNGNSTYYAIIDAQSAAWEVGVGTYTASGNTLSRTTVLASTDANALVNFGAGTKDVILTQPAERALLVQDDGTGLIAGTTAFTTNGIPYADSTRTLTTSSALTFDGSKLVAPTFEGSLTGNAGTATKLATTRTLWGQSFDGSANVTGALSSVTALSMSGQLTNTVATGTAPLVITSTTRVANLNVATAGTADTLTTTRTLWGQNFDGSANVAGALSSVTTLSMSGQLTSTVATGTAPLVIASTTRVANLNVATAGTADTLTTTRTLWGQNFNGSANVTGNLTSVGNITGSGAVTLTATGGTLALTATGANSITASTNGTARWTLDSAGNLGLGVTPIAWGSNYRALQVTGFGTALFGLNGGGGQTYLGHNVYNDNTDFRYINSFAAAAMTTDGNGGWRWLLAPSGTAGSPITFTQAMTLDASGNLLVGTTVPAQTLSTNNVLTLKAPGVAAVWGVGPTSTYGSFYVSNNGVGVALAAGSTAWGTVSDERQKDIIEPITNAAEKVLSLRSVIGKYKNDAQGTRRSFLIAQDVQAVLPEAVDVDDDEDQTLSIKYTEVIPLLVAAIKEQQAIIESLTQRIAALEAK